MASSNVSGVEYGRYHINAEKGGKVIKMTDRFKKLTGYSEEDIAAGITFTDFLPEEDREEYIEMIKLIREGKHGAYLKHRFVRKDGSIIMVLCFGDDYTDPETGELRSVITICDVTESVVIEDKYEQSRRQLEDLYNNVPCGIVQYEVIGSEFRIISANKQYYSLFGYKSEEEHPGYGGKFFKRTESEQYRTDAVQAIHKHEIFETEIQFSMPDGTTKWLRLRFSYAGKLDNGHTIVNAVIVDITAAKQAQAAINRQTEQMRLLAENTDEIFVEYDVAKDTVILTNCFNRYSGESNVIENYMAEERYKRFIHPDDVEEAYKIFEACLHTPQKDSVQIRTNAFDKNYTWYKMPFVSVADETGKVAVVYGRLYSIDHMQRLKSRVMRDRAEIERLSTTDQTTGLLTRNAFKEQVKKYLNERYDPKYVYGIAYSDINDFSYVNDNFGFDAGNQMLRDFALNIADAEIYVTACRVYSDFFATLVRAESREKLIEHIKTTNTRFNDNQHKIYPASDLHISTGLYIFPSADIDVVIAMDNADLARKSVKGIKELPCGIYADRMRKQRSHDQAIAAELKNALLSGQIELFLQPKFSLDTRELKGAEALSRWRNPDGSYKLPYEFINVLEKVGYIIDLDMYMYETLLSTMARWRREGIELFPVSINFSRNHAGRKDFVEKLTALADFYNIETSLIEIEITESALMQDFNALYNDMKRLRDRGFKIDIDDFGMGYSSLSVLLNAPIDIVKVDKIFIDNIVTSHQARDYVNQMCTLINLTNKSIIFEGVETEAQAQILASSGHKLAQGWLFDKAISVPEFERKYLKINA